MARVKVKICGLKTPETVRAAVNAGADFIGLVFFPPSPRHVSIARAAELATLARRVGGGTTRVVALVVDATDVELRAIAERVRPDIIQAHGSETPSRVRVISDLTGCAVVRAFRLKGPEDLAEVAAFDGAIAFPLFDAWHDDAALPGGMGQSFDWRWLRGYDGDFMLAGGLTPQNVARAIAETGAPMVDVSSGVERARGVKDTEKITRFIAAAKGETV